MSQSGLSNVSTSLPDSVAEDFVTDSGTATPSGNVINILGGMGIDVTGAGNTVTVTSTENYFTFISPTIDFKVVANTTIFTVPVGLRFVPCTMYFIFDNVVAPGSDLNYNLGFTGANYDDWISGSTISSPVTNQFQFGNSTLFSGVVSAPASTAIVYRNYVGAGGTTYTGRVALSGFFI